MSRMCGGVGNFFGGEKNSKVGCVAVWQTLAVAVCGAAANLKAATWQNGRIGARRPQRNPNVAAVAATIFSPITRTGQRVRDERCRHMRTSTRW